MCTNCFPASDQTSDTVIGFGAPGFLCGIDILAIGILLVFFPHCRYACTKTAISIYYSGEAGQAAEL